jgi:hypothetical protein
MRPGGSDAEIVSQSRSLLSLRRYSHVSGLEPYAAPDKGSVGTTLDCIAERVLLGNPVRNYSAEGPLTLSCFPFLLFLLPFLLPPVHLLFGRRSRCGADVQGGLVNQSRSAIELGVSPRVVLSGPDRAKRPLRRILEIVKNSRYPTADRVRKPATRAYSMGSGLPGTLQTLSNFLRTIIPCKVGSRNIH